MIWLIELLLELVAWPFRDRDTDRSIVGKSRIEEESEHFWRWVCIAIVSIATGAWIAIRLNA